MASRRDRRPHKLALLGSSFLFVLLFTMPSLAQRQLLTKPGQRGQIVIDQLSGFRGGVSGIVGNKNELAPTVAYYGPIGFAVQHYGQTDANFNSNTDTVTATTFWLAPSADVFVIDHLSVGGMVEIAYTSNSASEPQPPNGNAQSVSVSVPSNTSFAILPRVGWMFGLTDRWAIWPRLSLGYVSYASGSVPNGQGLPVGGSSIYGFALDVDVGVLFRVNETFFLRLAPELGTIPGGGNSTQEIEGRTSVSVTTSANYLEFSLAGGIGVMFDL
jgi:hypothetical protein